MKKVTCIVENEKVISDLMNQYLGREGYGVRSYHTYKKASAHIMDGDTRLWILGVMLDDKSSFDLIEKIRLQGKGIPVIFMSARDKESDRTIGLEKGSDGYITKLLSPKELVLRVDNVIKHVYKDDSNQVMVDGYEPSEEQREVFDHGVEIDLTTKEFDLLALFIKNEGVASNRDKILTDIWEENYFGSDRVVGDTLRGLRRKPPNLSIHTIYGYGYRLEQ